MGDLNTSNMAVEYEGVSLDIPAGVGVSFKNGSLRLSFTKFSGEILLTPANNGFNSAADSPHGSQKKPYRWDSKDLSVAALLNESPDQAAAPIRAAAEIPVAPPALSQLSQRSSSIERFTEDRESLPLGQVVPEITSVPEPPAVRSLLDNIVTDDKSKLESKPDSSKANGRLESIKKQPVTNEKDASSQPAKRVQPRSAAAARQSRISSITKRHRETEQLPDAKAAKLPHQLPGNMCWKEASTRGQFPSERWGCSCSYVKAENTMYVIGGVNAHDEQLDDVYILSLDDCSWVKSRSTMNNHRAWHTATVLDHEPWLLVLGGENCSKESGERQFLSSLEALDLASKIWFEPSTKGKAPSPRAGMASCLVGKQLVVFGGTRGRKWLNDLCVLDTVRWTWSQPRTSGVAPFPRSYHSMHHADGFLYVFGGNDSSKSFKKVHKLDLKTWSWEHPEMTGGGQLPVTGHSTTSLSDSFMLTYGGWDPNSDSVDQEDDEEVLPAFTAVRVLDLSCRHWHEMSVDGLGPMGGRAGHSSISCPSPDGKSMQIYVFGGRAQDDVFNTTHILTVNHSQSASSK